MGMRGEVPGCEQQPPWHEQHGALSTTPIGSAGLHIQAAQRALASGQKERGRRPPQAAQMGVSRCAVPAHASSTARLGQRVEERKGCHQQIATAAQMDGSRCAAPGHASSTAHRGQGVEEREGRPPPPPPPKVVEAGVQHHVHVLCRAAPPRVLCVWCKCCGVMLTIIKTEEGVFHAAGMQI